MRYDSSVQLCCCFGLRAFRNSCRAWFPSSESWQKEVTGKMTNTPESRKVTYLDAKLSGPYCGWHKTMNRAWSDLHSRGMRNRWQIKRSEKAHGGLDDEWEGICFQILTRYWLGWSNLWKSGSNSRASTRFCKNCRWNVTISWIFPKRALISAFDRKVSRFKGSK